MSRVAAYARLAPVCRSHEALAADPRLHPRIVAAAAPFLGKVEGILREGVERGEIRGDVPVGQLALVFTGLGELLLVLHWGSGGVWPKLEEIPDLGVGLFLEGAGSGNGRRA